MAPQANSIQQENLATPGAEDVANFLREALAGGSGIATPLQRQSAGNIGSFIQQNQMPFELGPEFAAIQELFQQQNQTGAANITEQFSGLGGRNSTSLGTALGRFQAEAAPREGALLGEILRNQFNQQQQNILGGTALQNQIGQQGFAPFLSLLGQGTLPPVTTFTQNPFITGLQGIAGLGAGVGGALSGLGPRGAGVFG